MWCDGYVAAAQEEEIDVAFTFLSETKQLDKRLQNITIPENQIVELSDFKISKMDSRYKNYAFYSIETKMQFHSQGQYSLDHITFEFKDGKYLDYQIGNWNFDIGNKDSSGISTWEAAGASASADVFPFHYKSKKSGLSSCTISTGIQKPLPVKCGSDQFFSGNIDIQTSEAPLKYIRSKLIYTLDGKECVGYGKGCYCGALDFSEDDIELSYQNLG